MTGCRNAPAGFAMSVCLGPVNVTTVEYNYVCLCVCVCLCLCVCGCVGVLGGGIRHICVHL